MKGLLSLAFVITFCSGCSIYRSEGRKQFESEAPGKIAAASFQLKSCERESRIETWFHQEFPAKNYEMVVFEQDLEIWRTVRAQRVEVKALQKFDNYTQSCIYEFASLEVWNLYKDSFIRELQNNLMTLE